MAIIGPADEAGLPRKVQLALGLARARHGRVPGAAAVVAREPFFFERVSGLAEIEGKDLHLAPRLRLLLKQRVATLNGCDECRSLGRGAAERAGVPVDDLLADPASLAPAERAALDFAEALARGSGCVRPDLVQAVLAHFREEEVLEIVVRVAVECFHNVLNRGLGVGAEEPKPAP